MTTTHALTAVLTPHGLLRLDPVDGEAPLEEEVALRLEAAFARGQGHGLLQLGTSEAGSGLPPVLSWWRDFAMRYVAPLLAAEPGKPHQPPVLVAADRDELVDAAPPMRGGEYLRADVLEQLWQAMDRALSAELAASRLPLQEFLAARDSRWRLVGRVHFNLAENRRDPEFPFAFMATYTSALAAHGALRHLPLGHALREFAGAGNRTKLLHLLSPVQQASEACPWLKESIDNGEIFQPLRWTPRDAVNLLRDVEALERAGIVVRMPAGWHKARPSRAGIEAMVGSTAPSLLGIDALLDFRVSVSLDGEILTPAEIDQLLSSTHGLALLRGKWVEVDAEQMRSTLARFEDIERLAANEGLPFSEAMRLLAGAEIGETASAAPIRQWGHVSAGAWLSDTLAACRSPDGLATSGPGEALKATLRPYQQTGLHWLAFLTRLGLGACLADDMGLGKTIQVLALLLTVYRGGGEDPSGRKTGPSLLVAPASLLGNWAAEAQKFAPSLRLMIAHPSFTPPDKLKAVAADELAGTDLVVTSYATLLRLGWLTQTDWHLAVLDEAQVIKNPSAKQTRAVKSLRSAGRIVLTGTPIENNLTDLWSIFDFINPGLLGSSKAFSKFAKALATQEHVTYTPLRRLVAPYILRRLKTDKSIIADLPDKTEVKAYCHLTRKQAVLYQAGVAELADRLEQTEGIQRSGLIFAFLMRLKQICNHPSQWLDDGSFDPEDSGKFARLREIAETIASRQEKLLVFTQFKEVMPALEKLLGAAFGRPGLLLHGDTPIARRKDLVASFQEDERMPFFLLSLKAGGSGLNLTAASHVVHFDRWWNPSVENQATDRAFRIGQKRNVLVHKFVCRGTIEDRIDQLIESKRQLAQDFLSTGGEVNLTDMDDRELLSLVALDLNAAMKEEG